jgi:ribose transport system ATP-binding protein
MDSKVFSTPLLMMKSIQMEFNNIPVLKGIDFTVNSGEIVSIIGSNGAGKSTLMNVLAGVHHADAGEIWLEGEKVSIQDPNVAERLKIGMVHQEPALCENMRVYENIFLNHEYQSALGHLDRSRMQKESVEVLDSLGFHIDVEQRVRDLSLVNKVIVSIAKAMLMNPKLLILDEVTAALNQKEAEHLFGLIHGLRDKGLGIVFIGHKIREIVQISDRVFVLRDGVEAGTFDRKVETLNEKDIINLMLGESEWKGEYSKREIGQVGDRVLLSVNSLSKHEMFSDITFDVHENEIVGLAGLKGSGITELMYSIFGIMQYDDGELRMKGKPLKAALPEEAIRRGICMITNDRQQEGLAMGLPIENNVLVASLEKTKGNDKLINKKLSTDITKDYISKLQIKATGPRQQVQFLSGGNQQKVVVAKWLFRDSDVILIDEPTRGVDIKAKNEIYNLLLQEKAHNKGIVVYSPETRELLNICNRIIIIDRGRIIEEVNRDDPGFTEKSILEVMHSY